MVFSFCVNPEALPAWFCWVLASEVTFEGPQRKLEQKETLQGHILRWFVPWNNPWGFGYLRAAIWCYWGKCAGSKVAQDMPDRHWAPREHNVHQLTDQCFMFVSIYSDMEIIQIQTNIWQDGLCVNFTSEIIVQTCCLLEPVAQFVSGRENLEGGEGTLGSSSKTKLGKTGQEVSVLRERWDDGSLWEHRACLTGLVKGGGGR